MTNYPPPTPHQEPEEYNYEIGNISVFIDTNDEGSYDWEAVIIEQVIVGPYPGSPDTMEYVLGTGTGKNLSEVKWQVERAVARYRIREEVEMEEEENMEEKENED